MRIILSLITALSGIALFTFEPIFLLEFRYLFGNYYYSYTMVMAVLFAGYLFGAPFWGKRADRSKNPLRILGMLELAIIFTSITAYACLRLFSNSGISFRTLFPHPFTYRTIETLFAGIILFPWSFAAGGHLPVLMACRNSYGIKINPSFYYFINFAAGIIAFVLVQFLMIPLVGIYSTLASGTCVSLLVIVIVFTVTTKNKAASHVPNSQKISVQKPLSPALIAVAGISGFCATIFQMSIIRSFSLVDQNSIISLTTVAALVMITYALAALLVSCIHNSFNHGQLLTIICLCAAFLTVLFPDIFVATTDGILPISFKGGSILYLLRIAGLYAITALLPAFFIGSTYPLTFSISAKNGTNTGWIVLMNTIGVIFGYIISGTIDIPLWFTIRLIAGIYAFGGLIIAFFVFPFKQIQFVTLGSVLTCMFFLFRIGPPTMLKNAELRGMEVLASLEKGASVATLVSNKHTKYILLNNQYSIGSSSQFIKKQCQTTLPFLLYDGIPEKIGYIGMGTGTTAGASLLFPVKKVIICEISPSVTELSRKYFSEFNLNLFSDDRVKVIQEDGRAFFRGNNDTFDMIIGDLFIPWQTGTGSLFTREHFLTITERLSSSGMFIQWLPFFQLTMDDLGTIITTANSVFQHVTLFRLPGSASFPLVALVCSPTLPMSSYSSRVEKSLSQIKNIPGLAAQLQFLTDNNYSVAPILKLESNGFDPSNERWQEYPINTDQKPFFEVESALRMIKVENGKKKWLTDESLQDLWK